MAPLEEDHRAWGFYRVLEDEPGHKVKRIVVMPGLRLSLQHHRRRAEHWFVLEGDALVTRATEDLRLGPGESVDIPPGGASHRIASVERSRWCSSRCSTGTNFGEDDIERLEDDFGRAGRL